MSVDFYEKRGDKFLVSGLVLFKHMCNFDVNSRACVDGCVF